MPASSVRSISSPNPATRRVLHAQTWTPGNGAPRSSWTRTVIGVVAAGAREPQTMHPLGKVHADKKVAKTIVERCMRHHESDATSCIETLSATFAGGFLLAQPVGRARDGSFSLAQPVGRSCHGPYVLAEPAGRTRDGSFSLAGSVGRACDGSSLLAPPVGRACHGRSSLAEPVGRTSHGTYPLAQPVGRACDGSSLRAQPVGRASLGVFSPAALQSRGAESRSSARKATDSPTAHLRFEALLRSASARSFLQRNSRLPVAPSSC
jgi:hypothetical protein